MMFEQAEAAINSLEDDMHVVTADITANASEIMDLKRRLLALEAAQVDTSQPEPVTFEPAPFAPDDVLWPPPPLKQPPGDYADPVFGTKITRLPDGMRHVYSSMQPWPPTGDDKMLVTDTHGSYTTLGSAQPIADLDPRRHGGALLTVAKDRLSIALSGRRVAGVPSPIVREASYEDPWGDDLAVLCEDGRVRVYDLSNGAQSNEVFIDEPSEVDWVRACANATIVVQFKDERGLMYWPNDRPAFHVTEHHRHGVLCETPDDIVFATTSWYDARSSGDVAIILHSLTTSGDTEILLEIDWARASHFSAWAGGLCVTAGTQYEDNPLKGEIYLVDWDGDVRRVAHHHSASSSYWAQPQAAISRDGSRIAFATDWGGTSKPQGYVVEL